MRPPGPGPRWGDRVAGIVLGILLGLGVIVAFVFLGSEDTIDAPRISRSDGGGGEDEVPVVRIVNGAPPPSGPARLASEQGASVRFTVDSAEPTRLEVPGYGISRAVEAGRSSFSFSAKRPGQYAVIVAGSNIAVATLRISRR